MNAFALKGTVLGRVVLLPTIMEPPLSFSNLYRYWEARLLSGHSCRCVGMRG
jgi:hypothetical protein